MTEKNIKDIKPVSNEELYESLMNIKNYCILQRERTGTGACKNGCSLCTRGDCMVCDIDGDAPYEWKVVAPGEYIAFI